MVTGDTRVPILIGSITLEEITHPFGLITTLSDQSLFGSQKSALSVALRADKAIAAKVPTGGEGRVAPILALAVGNEAGQTIPKLPRVVPDTLRP